MATIVHEREKKLQQRIIGQPEYYLRKYACCFFPLGFPAATNSYVRRNPFLDMCFLFLFWHCIIGP